MGFVINAPHSMFFDKLIFSYQPLIGPGKKSLPRLR